MSRANFFELPSKDLPRAKRFYREVFGWAMTDFGPSYACTMTGEVDVGLQGDATEASQAPLPVIQVDDLQEAYSAVTSAGGQIVKPVFAFPGGRRFHFHDLDGNELAIMQPD